MKLFNPFGSASPPACSGRVLVAAMLLLLAFVGRVNAQVGTNYIFEPSSGTYVNLASGTAVDVIEDDDAISGNLPIGFTFVLDGVSYTQFRASSNGWMSLGTGASVALNANNLNTGTPGRPFIAPFWDDLDGRGGLFNAGRGVASYRTTGTAPNRVLTMEWRNYEWDFSMSNANSSISFQALLYETTNIIEFIYRQEATAPVGALGASIGISGVGTGANNFLSLNNAGASPTASGTTETTTIATRPSNGRVYRFIPCAQPQATFTVVENCAGQTFMVDMNVSTFGMGTSGTLSYSVNNGAPTTQAVNSVGVTSFGPFPVSSTVTAGLTNAYPSCGGLASGSLFSTCAVDLICGNTLNVSHCYSNNDTRTFTYTAPSPETVTITFIGGTIDLNDIVRIYDGTDNNGTLLTTSTVSSLAGLTATSLGQSMFVEIVSDASNSCATGQQTSWDVEVKCTPACTSPDGAVTVLTDCNDLSFSLDVEVLFTGDGSTTTLSYSVDGGPAQTVPGLMDLDVENIGPFSLTSTVQVHLLHETQSSCNKNLGNFTRNQICAPANDLCSNATSLTVNAPAQCPSLATAGTTFDAGTEIAAPGCDGSGTISDVWYTFNSGFNTSPIQIAITAGTVGHYGVEIYTACGGTLVGCVPGSPAVVNLSNATAYTDYRVRVFTNSGLGAVGSFNICVSATPAPTACGQVARDPGGTGNYSNNQNVTTTYCSSNAGEVVQMTFTQFATELNFDFVRIYNGPSTASPLLGTFSGSTIPGPFTSTHPSGCLTVNFTSDVSNVAAGYAANLTCCVAPTPTASASNNGPYCAGQNLQLNCITNIGTVFSWTGPNGFTSALQNPVITGASASANGTYTVTVRNGVNGCPVTATTTVQVSGAPGPIDAGANQVVCATPGTATMAAVAPTAGTGVWTQVGGGAASITNASLRTTTITGLSVAGSPYTFRWTVSNAPCAAAFDEVTVTVNPLPSAANAGGAQTICSNGSAELDANVPSVGNGAWSVVSGPSTSLAQFSAVSAANATFTPAGGVGTYTLRWTISNSPCTATTSDVAITVDIAPGDVVVNTGSYAICQGGTVPGGQGLSATCPAIPQASSTAFPGSNFISEGTTMTTRATLAMPALPPGAVVTAARLKLFNVVANTNLIGNAQRQNIRVALSGAYTLAETQLTTATGAGTVSPNPVINLTGFPVGGGNINLRTRQTTDNFWTNPDATIASALIEVDYTVPSTVRWYDAPTSGTLVFSGNLFDPIGQAVVSNGTASSSTFHATCGFNVCESIREPATFDVIAPADAGTDVSISLCGSDAAVALFAQLGGTPDSGGSWSGPSAVVNGLFDPATMTAGTYTYTVNSPTPCPPVAATVTVTVIAPPDPGTNGTITVCNSDPAISLFAQLGGTPDVGGAWSGPSAVINGLFDPSTMTAGDYTYTVNGIAPCPAGSATVTVNVNTAPDPGTNGVLTVCSIDAASSLFAQLGGTPDAGGAWTGPSAVVNGQYDPATMDPGVYTYTVTGNSPCLDAAATVTVTEIMATPWYADQDNDGFGDPAVSQLACTQPPGHVANNDDTCPTFSGLIGDACVAGPGFVLGQIDGNCACVGQQCTTDLGLEFSTDMNSFETTWELRTQGTNILVQSGGGWYPPNATLDDQTCLPDGCYVLRVLDAGGDGMTNGGYVLRTIGTNERIIDNRNNFATGAVSMMSGGQSFCLPLGTNKPIYTSCDKLDWTTGQYMVAAPDAAVSAQWQVGNQSDDGYEFWIFDPNGSYSFRRFRSHHQSDGFGPANATRACHMRLNNWSPASHIPANTLMNVRIRARINGVNGSFGPACRMAINPVLAACPRTKLMDIPNDPDLSCGAIRPWGNGNYVHARPVSGGNLYQFRFRITAEAFEVVRTSTSYFTQLNWTNLPLQDGKTYDVDVRVSKNNGATWCSTGDTWGDICQFTIDNTPANNGNQNFAVSSEEVRTNEVKLFPNPNRGDLLSISLSAVEEGVTTVSVDIYDLTGKRVSARSIPVNDGFINTVLDLNGNLNAGVYLVNITAGKAVHTERLVIQP